MPRRLIRDAERERAEQERLQARISAAGRRALQTEIRRASEQMATSWAKTGEIPTSDEHYRRVRELVNRLHEVAIRAFSARMEEQLKSSTPRELKSSGDALYNRLVLEYLGEGADRIADDIAETTRNLIMRLIGSGRANGLSNVEIVASVRAAIPTLSQARAALITRTEVHGAANYANLATARESGVVTQKEWIATEDDRTRTDPFDHSNAGQVVGLNEPFIVSGEELQYPGDPTGSPGNVINCRCASVFLVDD